MLFKRLILLFAISFLLSSSTTSPASAVPLTGSGDHLPIAGLVDGVIPALEPWTLTSAAGILSAADWFNPAQDPWLGTVGATGVVPGGGFIGDSSWDFSALNHGSLPVGTSVRLGDLDASSGPEITTLIAYDVAGAVITTPWLEEPSSFSGQGGPATSLSIPSWNWTGASYVFNGNTVTGTNPTIIIFMLTNVEIFDLDIIKPNFGHNVQLLAPTGCYLGTGTMDDGTLIAVGVDDDSWNVAVDAAGGTVPRKASVIGKIAAWDVIPNSAWVAANQSTNSVSIFTYCFDLDTVSSPSVTLDLLVDNEAIVRLNGTEIGSVLGNTGANFSLPSFPIGTTDASLFTAGQNCLDVSVRNRFLQTGWNLQGGISNGSTCTALPNASPAVLPTIPSFGTPVVPSMSVTGRLIVIVLMLACSGGILFRRRTA